MNHAVLQSLYRVSGLTCHRPCVRHPAGTLRQLQSTLKTILFCSAYDMIWRFPDCLETIRTARYTFTYIFTTTTTVTTNTASTTHSTQSSLDLI